MNNIFAKCVVISVFSIAISACEKSEPSANPIPDLAPPKLEKSAPQAEVHASSGPVELSLLLHRTQIKLGSTLWHQIRVRNIGRTQLLVTDGIFHDPWQMAKNISGEYGIFIEVLGPDGKPLQMAFHPDSGNDIDFGVSDLGQKKATRTTIRVNSLQSGESVETKSWFHYGDWAKLVAKRPRPTPIAEYAELEFFDLNKPGHYKVRAIYNKQLGEKDLKSYRELGLTLNGHVLIRTPWISVEVVP